MVVGLSSHPSILGDGSIPASGEDLAVTFHLPYEYHGVIVQRDPGQKLLSLNAAFMDASFECGASETASPTSVGATVSHLFRCFCVMGGLWVRCLSLVC